MKPTNKFYDFRRSNGASRVDVARATGITVRTIYNIENGRFNPSYATITRLADFYGLSVPDFIRAVQA